MTRFYCLMLAGFAGVATAMGAEFRASVYNANSWQEHGDNDTGMYAFPTDSYARSVVMIDSDLDASGGGTMTEDFYFCTSEIDFGPFVDITHFIINPDTWTATSSLRDGTPGSVATDLAYDHVSMKIYGCFSGDSEEKPMVFGTIDPSTGLRQAISEIEIPWIACSFDRNGQLYAVNMAGELMKVDRTDGSSELLGNLGFTATRRSSGAIDPETGLFYVVVTNQDASSSSSYYTPVKSELYAVDLHSATASLKYIFGDGEAIGGMYFPGAIAPDGAPAQVTDLSFSFDDAALSGSVSFTVPATTFEGASAQGPVSYLLRASGSLLAQGTAQPGERVERTVSVSEPGLYEIDLMLTNEAGRGPKTRFPLWIGEDTPVAVAEVGVAYTPEGFRVAWEAPTGSQHGGWYDPSKIRYSVTRQPEGVTVSSDLTSTELLDPVTLGDGVVAYRYEVVMSYGDKTYPAVSSPTLRVGSAPLPFLATFEEEDALKEFTVLDADGDRIEWYREWEFYVETTDELIPAAVFPYSSSRNGADDWLFTPPFNLKKDVEYLLTVKSLTDYEGAEPALEILLGGSPDPESMTFRISGPFPILSLLPEEKSFVFAAPADGLSYIAFHACSEPDRSAIALTEIALSLRDPSSVADPSLDGLPQDWIPQDWNPQDWNPQDGNESLSPMSGFSRSVLYTIDGRRVSATSPLAPGLYLTTDGRKLLVR